MATATGVRARPEQSPESLVNSWVSVKRGENATRIPAFPLVRADTAKSKTTHKPKPYHNPKF